MIDVLLACHPDRIIPESVMTSILTQGIAVDIHICAHIGDGAWKSRQYLLEQWRSKPKKGQFVLTMDNDIILPIGAIKKQWISYVKIPTSRRLALASNSTHLLWPKNHM